MDRRVVATAVVALAVALAGCGGGADPGAERPSETPEPTATPSPTETPTPTPTPTPSLADVSIPPGASEEAVTDREALLEAHAQGLDGESVTVAIDFQLTVDGDGDEVSFRGKVTPDDDRGWIQVVTAEANGTYYTEGGTTYERVITEGQTRYGTTDEVSAIPQSPRFGADARLRDALYNANWTFDGVVRRDGELLLRYDATDVVLPSGVEVDRENASVDTDGTLLVDQDGVVRHVEIGASVETDQESVEYGLVVSFEAIGSTTIERPDWVDLAETRR